MELYRKLVAQLSIEEFVARFDHLFIVKRPAVRSTTGQEPQSIDFLTTQIDTRRRGGHLDDDEFANAWLAEPIKKKPGKPYPERIGIGRAVNCDISIRAPYISKLHAFFLVEAGLPLRLADNKSANGTWVNGRRVTSEPLIVEAETRISLGALELEIRSARQLYALVAAVAAR
jgi:hypothetical protein